MTEQQQHLSNLIQQRQLISQEIVVINSKLNENKEFLLKVQGAIEYLEQIGISLPETDAPSADTETDS